MQVAHQVKKKKHVAILLALFLGGFGVHKFYLRRPGQGVFYILLNTFSFRLFGFTLATILGVADAVAMMMMDERDFDRKYNWYHMEKGYQRTDRRTRTTSRTEERRARTKSRTTTKHPVRSNAKKRSGIKKLRNFDVNEAIQDLNEALEVSPKDKDIHFHLATAYSLNEDAVKSLRHLQEAVQLGIDRSLLASDDLLAYIRIHPAYERFVNNGYIYVPQAGDEEKPRAFDIRQEKVKQKREEGR
jgi:TM2 domain-containing membrane protein YozV